MDHVAGRPAYAGIDTHKDTNELALLDALGRAVGTWRFPTGADGYAALEARIGDPAVPVGVEGTRSYGAGVAAYLRSRGYEVYEMVRPARQQRRRGKSDRIDAMAAAENLAAGRGLAPKLLEGEAADVRWLLVAREQLVRQMTAMSNCVDSMLVTAPQAVRDRYGAMRGGARMEALSRSRPKDACCRAMRLLARRWLSARAEAGALEEEIRDLLLAAYPALLGAPGVGPISAARLVAAAGSNPERLGGEAAFSMLCGTSPIPASSGKTCRHRLNRGGDRQANRAIHEIARVRMATDERTRAYVARKLAEGKTKREAVRCLCRFIAREVYRLLTGPQEALPSGTELRSRREAMGMSRDAMAVAVGVTRRRLELAEYGRQVDGPLLRAYDELLWSMEGKRPAMSG